jgi:hypothetical protein
METMLRYDLWQMIYRVRAMMLLALPKDLSVGQKLGLTVQL